MRLPVEMWGRVMWHLRPTDQRRLAEAYPALVAEQVHQTAAYYGTLGIARAVRLLAGPRCIVRMRNHLLGHGACGVPNCPDTIEVCLRFGSPYAGRATQRGHPHTALPYFYRNPWVMCDEYMRHNHPLDGYHLPRCGDFIARVIVTGRNIQKLWVTSRHHTPLVAPVYFRCKGVAPTESRICVYAFPDATRLYKGFGLPLVPFCFESIILRWNASALVSTVTTVPVMLDRPESRTKLALEMRQATLYEDRMTPYKTL